MSTPPSSRISRLKTSRRATSSRAATSGSWRPTASRRGASSTRAARPFLPGTGKGACLRGHRVAGRSGTDGSVTRRGYAPADIWSLDLEGAVPGRTWWWWFWLFFLRGGREGAKPRQVMIMHTTRLAPHLKVEGVDWRPAGPPRVEPPDAAAGSPTRSAFSGLRSEERRVGEE